VCCALFEYGVICVFLCCLIVVPLPLGKNPLAVQLNDDDDDDNNNNNKLWLSSGTYEEDKK
jgi:hypothetical protein